MEIFDSLVAVFNFIYSILQTIIDGIYGVIQIFGSITNLILSITKILPEPLYSTFYFFISLYVIIFTYKIFRKG